MTLFEAQHQGEPFASELGRLYDVLIADNKCVCGSTTVLYSFRGDCFKCAACGHTGKKRFSTGKQPS